MNEKAEKAVGAVEVAEWRTVRELQKAQEAAASALKEAQGSHDRIEYLAERAETEIRERARREVSEWAAGVKADPDAVVLTLATTGLEDPVDVVEMVLMGMDGETLLHEPVRPAGYGEKEAVEIEEGATGMHGHTAASLADASTFAEVYPNLAASLEGKRTVVYNAEYVLRVLSQTIERYGLEPLDLTRVEDAMAAYAREGGEWSVDRQDYYPRKLPDQDGTPIGNARATLALVDRLASEHSGSETTAGASGDGSGRRGAEVDINIEDFEDIAFRAVIPSRVRYPLVF